MLLLLTGALLATQVQTSGTAGRDSAGGRPVGVYVRVGNSPGSEPVYRIPVTAAHLATAFRTPAARTLLTRARHARFEQDSALHTYDAKVRQRISVGMHLRANGRERLVMRDEGVARVQWDYKNGAVVDMLGKRTTVPVLDEPAPLGESVRRSPGLPIPYFPGRETLWIGGSVARVEVSEEEFVHPIAEGSEAYYKYSVGDSIEFTLPDNRSIMLVELRIEARQPHWNLVVGSFWFDRASAQLVRAVYRPSVEINLWEIADEAAARDTTEDEVPFWAKGLISPMRAVMQVFTVEYSLFEGRFWLPVAMGAEGKIQATFIHVPATFEERYEYATVNGPVDVAKPMSAVRAPPRAVTTGTIRILRDSLRKAGLDSAATDSVVGMRYGYQWTRMATFMAYSDSVRRSGLTWGAADSLSLKHFGYKDRQDPYRFALRDSLTRNGGDQPFIDSVVHARFDAPRERSEARMRARRDTLAGRGLKSAQIDSAIRAQDRARFRVQNDSVRAVRDSACKVNGHIALRTRMYEETVDVLVRTPCDLQSLATSPELPKSAYEAGEEMWSKKDTDKMMRALDFALQAAWGPQKVKVDWGFGQSRYNRVEGFSTGIALKQDLGLGLTWSGQLRGGQGDKEINAELGLERGNGRSALKLNAYRRLTSASDWGSPLTFSASLPALLYARDEGFYFRSWGGELTRSSDFHGQLVWRVFAEEQSNAPVTTRFTIFGGSHDDRFIDNVVATKGTYAGGSVRWQHSWGLEPRGWNRQADFRLEGAGGATEYARGALDMTVSRALVGPVSFGLTGAAGSSVGDVPPQRQWILGSVQTVRGQEAGVAAGDAFWFSRTELGLDRSVVRTSIFSDLGWAGSRRDDWGRSQRLLSGVGVGFSFLQGMLRFDVARGLWPKERWRVDFSLEARF